MKTVFSNSEICHVWANQNQSEGRTPTKGIFFRDGIIYSYGYHFPMAAHFDQDEPICLFTFRSYSNSTAKHLNYLHRATSHLKKVYCFNPENAIKGMHNENINTEIENIRNEASKLIKAKKPAIYLQEIERLKTRLKTYLDTFNLSLTPEQVNSITIESKESFIELLKVEKEKQEEQNKLDLINGKKYFAKYAKEWRNLIDNTFKGKYSEKVLADKYYNSIGCPILLRVKNGNVETSKDIKIPIEKFKSYCEKLFLGEIKKDMNVYGYIVTNVLKDRIVIGCHNIPFSEIKAIYKTI